MLFPYINGEDLNTSPTHEGSRWVINFFDWPEERAKGYADCYAIALDRVKPGRDKINRERNRERWWIYGEARPGLYRAIQGMERVLAISRVSKVVQPVFVATGQVLSEQVVVFAYDDDFHFGVLTSAFHWWWAVTYASTMRTDLRYTPSDCFETFPQPGFSADVEAAGRALDAHRAPLMVANDEGLTKTYNRVHNPAEQSAGIIELRRLHVELDHAVATAFGWGDLALDHGFHDTPQGRRYTLGPSTRTEILDRLSELNHQRYAEEVAAGRHAAKGMKAGKRATKAPAGNTLFG